MYWDVLACDIPRPNQWSGVSPFKGRLMDEILDAESKVVEHQIAPPLGPLRAGDFNAWRAAPDPASTMPATPSW